MSIVLPQSKKTFLSSRTPLYQLDNCYYLIWRNKANKQTKKTKMGTKRLRFSGLERVNLLLA